MLRQLFFRYFNGPGYGAETWTEAFLTGTWGFWRIGWGRWAFEYRDWTTVIEARLGPVVLHIGAT